MRGGRERRPMPFDDKPDHLAVEVGGKHPARRRLEPLLGAVHDQFADAFRIERIVRGAYQRQHVLRPFETALEHALAASQAGSQIRTARTAVSHSTD